MSVPGQGVSTVGVGESPGGCRACRGGGRERLLRARVVRQSPGHWGGADKGGHLQASVGVHLSPLDPAPPPNPVGSPRGRRDGGPVPGPRRAPALPGPCQPPTGTTAEVPGWRLDPWPGPGPGPERAGRAPGASRPAPRRRRLRQPEHKILQQLRSCGNDVFVVTEVLQTQEEVEVTRAQKQEGCGQFALPGALRLQVRGVGRGRAGVGEAGGSGRAWPAGI